MTHPVCLLAVLASAMIAAQPADPLHFPTAVGVTWEHDDGGSKSVTKTVARAFVTLKKFTPGKDCGRELPTGR